jgi:hypothetical protein
MAAEVLNTDADLDGKTLVVAENPQTITGLQTFSRSTNPPFAVNAGAAKVANLNADQVDGKEAPTGDIVGTSDTQTLTAKTLSTGTVVAVALTPNANNTRDIGLTGTRFKDLFLAGNADIDGTIDVASTLTLGGVATGAAQPRASASNNGTQSLTSGTETIIALDSEDYDVGGLHSTVTNTSRMTIPAGAGGVYLCVGFVTYAANATGVRQAWFVVNGTNTDYQRAQDGNPSGTNASRVLVSAILQLSAGDYVELAGRQTSGGALNAGSATQEQRCRFQIVKLW